ncbi:sensor histidine kinase [Aquisalinus flavus]|uniref:HAMP domain-containing protein n=1 Tax=Aquisalinus flavus TaxID=1526572 RepID=A0A8J2V5H1_9PROT|nr:sensor histidine kinase [Aquisalinus flavus]MBD0426451.1 sensor histidine kinase [Aquisalinus flavus]UNE47995.1 sensor histidine kinase [Aquisalinus flavus]GGD07799.1 hypothetical protein GCM10011342_15850 [Aquisalinus flavus]
MSVFLWTPFSISFLVQLLLGTICTGYLFFRLVTESRRGRMMVSNVAVTAAAFSLTCFIGLNFLAETLHPDLATWCLPWEAPFGTVALLAITVFVYNYPVPLVRLRSVESIVVAGLSLLYLMVEVWAAVWRVQSQSQGFVEYRPGVLDLVQLMTALWLLVVMVRQYLRAVRRDAAAGVTPGVSLWRLVTGEGLPTRASSVRAFLIVSLIPVAAIVLLTLRSYWILGGVATEIGLCWLMLLVLCGFSLVYLNYIPERSSFLTKITGVTLTTLLSILCGISWIIGTVYAEAFDNDGIPESGTAIRFQLRSDDSYFVSNTAFRFDNDLGDRQPGAFAVDLDPVFPFYGVERNRLFVDPNGIVSFDGPSSLRHVTDRFGGTGAIFPLVLDTAFRADVADSVAGEPESGLYFRQATDRILLTWYNASQRAAPDALYTYQVALYPNGVIEIAYRTVPDTVRANVISPLSSPALAGITPGWLNGEIDRVTFGSDLPLDARPMTGLVEDYRLAFLIYLNQIYTPVAAFTLLMTLAVSALMPLIFQRTLVRPLNRLLEGVQSFRRGTYPGAMRIFYKDEIGFLTRAFSEMANAQIALVQSLEDQVAARTQAAVSLADRNARLEERNHLSGELHDAVSQKLFSATMIADRVSGLVTDGDRTITTALSEIRGLNRAALSEMRMLMADMRPGGNCAETLGFSLKALVSSVAAAERFRIQLQVEGDTRLPDAVHKVFYRIAQESLNNIVKHSEAESVTIFLDALPSQSILSIFDDGQGFELDKVPEGCLGLEIMRERVQKIGGNLEIFSAPGQGTSLTLIWYERDIV